MLLDLISFVFSRQKIELNVQCTHTCTLLQIWQHLSFPFLILILSVVQTESFFELCYICKLRVVCLRGNCPFLSWTPPRCTPCQPWSERWPETVRRSHCGYCQQVMGSPFPRSRSTLPSCGVACRTHPWWRRSSPARTSSWPMVSSLLSVTNTCNLYSMDQWNGISDPFSDPFS